MGSDFRYDLRDQLIPDAAFEKRYRIFSCALGNIETLGKDSECRVIRGSGTGVQDSSHKIDFCSELQHRLKP